MNIYLAGPIKGLTYEQATLWREVMRYSLSDHSVRSPMRGKQFLEGQGVIESTFDYVPDCTGKAITRRDLADVWWADVVVVNLLDAKEVSIGTVMEIAWAYELQRLVLLIMQDGSVHDHPMIREAAWVVVNSEAAALEVLLRVAEDDR